MRIVAGVHAEDRSRSRGTRTVASRCGFEAKDTVPLAAATRDRGAHFFPAVGAGCV